MATEKQRQKIIEALMELAADRDFLAIDLAEVADRAGVSLADLRLAYDSRVAILEDFARRIDREVLANQEDGMDDEPARERLFDVLMRRFDALAPYRASLKRLMASARRDPLLALSLNRIAVVSQRWMLTAAKVEMTGPWPGLAGTARAQALAVAWSQVLPVWLEEEDPNLPKTMAALDRSLRNLERLAGWAARVEGACERLMTGRKRRRAKNAPPRPETPEGDVVVGA